MPDTNTNPLSHSLDLLSDTYNYNHWIYSLLRPYVGKKVLEIGSGVGNLSQFFLNCEELTCLEPESEYYTRLLSLGACHRNICVVQGSIGTIPDGDLRAQQYDTVVCVNVLEHIQDDTSALLGMRATLKDGGTLLLFVPAVQMAYGSLDKNLGHFRRYSKRSVRHLANQAGLSVTNLRYVNALGLLGWWWSGRIKGEQFIDPQKARVMDRLVPYISALERLIPIPVGQSLFAVLQSA